MIRSFNNQFMSNPFILKELKFQRVMIYTKNYGVIENTEIRSQSSHLLVSVDLTRPWTSQVALVVRNPPANAGDIKEAWSGRSPGGGHGSPLKRVGYD